MAGGLRICTLAGFTLIGASRMAMFLFARNWSSMRLVVEVEAAIRRANDRPHRITPRVLPTMAELQISDREQDPL